MNPDSIPYIVHEAEMVRQERTVRRLWVLCIIMFLALVGSNAGWMYYENQFAEEVTTTYRTDASDGGNAIINESGRVSVNGESG